MKYLLLFFFITTQIYALDKISVGLFVQQIENKRNIQFVTNVVQKDINQNNKKINIFIKMYYDQERILQDFKNNKLKIMLLRSNFYFNNKNKLKDSYQHKWYLQFGKEKYQQYYLIANRSANTNDIFNDNNRYKVLHHIGYLNSSLWFDYLRYKNTKTKKNNFSYELVSKFNKLSYKVFFDKNYLALINKNAYLTAIEINPQLKRRIKILKKSEAIFTTYIGFTNKSLSKREKKNIFELASNITKILDNSRIADRLDIRLIPSLDQDDFLELDNFFEEFIKSKKEYLKKN